MALIDNMSNLLIPSGFKAGTLYSVLPNTALGDFDVVRNCTSTRVAEDKYVHPIAIDVPRLDYTDSTCPVLATEAEAEQLIEEDVDDASYWTQSGVTIEGDASTAGAELITDPTFSLTGTQAANTTGTYWSTGTDWTIGSDVAVSAATAASFAKLTVIGNTLTVGKLYKITYDVTTWTFGNIVFTDGVGIGTTYVGSTMGVGSSEEYFLAQGTEITIRSYGEFNGTIDNVSVKQVSGYPSPYKDASGVVDLGAFKMVESGADETHRIYKTQQWQINDRNFSLFVKPQERTKFYIGNTSNTDGVFFDLENNIIEGTIGEFENGRIQTLVNGWYRISATCTIGIADRTLSYGIYTTYTGVYSTDVSYQGDGTSGVLIYQPNLVESDHVSSLIPIVSGSTVTRLIDDTTLSDLVVKGFLSATEGTIAVTMSGVSYVYRYTTDGEMETFIDAVSQGSATVAIPTSYTMPVPSDASRFITFDYPITEAEILSLNP